MTICVTCEVSYSSITHSLSPPDTPVAIHALSYKSKPCSMRPVGILALVIHFPIVRFIFSVRCTEGKTGTDVVGDGRRRSGDVHFSSDPGCRRPASGTGRLARHLMPIGLCPSFVRRAGVAFHCGNGAYKGNGCIMRI